MKTIFRKRMIRIPFIVNAFVFFLGGFLYIDQGKIIFAVIFIVTGLCNLAALRFYSSRRDLTDLLLNLLNFIVAGMITADYFYSPSRYIQYAWLAVTLMYLFLTIRLFIRIRKNSPAATDP